MIKAVVFLRGKHRDIVVFGVNFQDKYVHFLGHSESDFSVRLA